MKSVRIKDIAKKAGVSIGTVDRVLHNRGEVKEATKEKILAIAKELNYKPNIAARVLKSRTTFRVAILIPNADKDNTFWAQHPNGIQMGVDEAHPYNIDAQYFYYEMHNGEDFIVKSQAILELKPDGVILAPILKKESIQFSKALDQLHIPYVFIDTYIDNTNCLSFIGEDAFQSGRVAASLIDFGVEPEKDILIVNIAKNLENTQHLNSRNQGFMSYFMESAKNTGMKISVEVPSEDENIVKETLNKVFKNNKNIGAVLVSSSRTYAVAQYVQENHPGLFMVGYEVFGKNISFLKQGVINFLIGQRPVIQSKKAFKRIVDHLSTNSTYEQKDFQPIDIINVENLKLYH